jgi:hypothetical protein
MYGYISIPNAYYFHLRSCPRHLDREDTHRIIFKEKRRKIQHLQRNKDYNIFFLMLEGKTEILSTEYGGFSYARIALELHFWSGRWQTYRNPRLSTSLSMGTALLHMQGGREGEGGKA